MVLAYLSRGDYFGRNRLLGGGVRTATCTALDHVELVRISGDDFRDMVARFPGVSNRSRRRLPRAPSRNQQRMQMVHDVPIDQFLSQGLMEAAELADSGLQNCTRCDACVNACADAHDGITRLVRDGLPLRPYLVARAAASAATHSGMVAARSARFEGEIRSEVIIEDWCIGCGLCAQNCPYGNINLHPFEVMVDDPERAGRKEGGHQAKSYFVRSLHAFERTKLASTLARTMPRTSSTRAHFSPICSARAPRNENDETRAAGPSRHLQFSGFDCGLHPLCIRIAARTARRRHHRLIFGFGGFGFHHFRALLGAVNASPRWRVGRAQAWMPSTLARLSRPAIILFHGGFHFGGGALTRRCLMWLLIITVSSGVFGAVLATLYSSP